MAKRFQKVENKLKKEAANKGLSGDRADRYVYGTISKLKNSQKRNAKNK